MADDSSRARQRPSSFVKNHHQKLKAGKVGALKQRSKSQSRGFSLVFDDCSIEEHHHCCRGWFWRSWSDAVVTMIESE